MSPILVGGKDSNSELASKLKHIQQIAHGLGQCWTILDHPAWVSCYSLDSQSATSTPPIAVVKPSSVDAIPDLLRALKEVEVSVATRCGGTGMSAGCIPSQGGVVLLTGHLKDIEFQPDQGTVTTGPGVTVKQLNQRVTEEGWWLPLEMESMGVAGLAGTVASRARSWKWGRTPDWTSCLRSVIAATSEGLKNVPVHLALGSEGSFGVITSLSWQLERKPELDETYSWPCTLEGWSVAQRKLQKLQAVVSVLWSEDQVEVRLTGDSWRVRPSYDLLVGLWGKPVVATVVDQVPRRSQFSISSWIPSGREKSAVESAGKLADAINPLKIRSSIQLLDGRLLLELYSSQELSEFRRCAEEFCVEWANVLDSLGGTWGGSYGIGKLRAPYLTPFVTEGHLVLLRDLCDGRDENLVPSEGKCLEKAFLEVQ